MVKKPLGLAPPEADLVALRSITNPVLFSQAANQGVSKQLRGALAGLKEATFDRAALEEDHESPAQIAAAEKNFNKVKKWLASHSNEDLRSLANETSSQLCNVLSYYLYGAASGQESREFPQFYTDEVRKGNISMGSSGPYLGSGSKNWDRQYHLKESTDIPQARQELKNSVARLAITYQDTKGNGHPDHFFLIARDDDQWKNMDHTHTVAKWRGRPVEWKNVHKVIYPEQ